MAHIFEGGWADASCARAATPKEAKGKQGFYLFYYKDAGEYLVHDLKLQEYGMTKAWCTGSSSSLRRTRKIGGRVRRRALDGSCDWNWDGNPLCRLWQLCQAGA